MIEGLLKHCIDMEVEKNFADTHGQSEVFFDLLYNSVYKTDASYINTPN